MQWYMMNTWTGREEELAEEVRRTVPPGLYGECFVLYQERIWRKQQRSIVHVENLFPGRVFITSRETGALLGRLERVPSMARLLAGMDGGANLLPLMEEDAEFLERLSGTDHMVRLSEVIKDTQGHVFGVTGPLEMCRDEVERYQFKKRYALVRHRLWGEDQTLALGILLQEDMEQCRWDKETAVFAEQSGIPMRAIG